jgi:hypothetical protein
MWDNLEFLSVKFTKLLQIAKCTKCIHSRKNCSAWICFTQLLGNCKSYGKKHVGNKKYLNSSTMLKTYCMLINIQRITIET